MPTAAPDLSPPPLPTLAEQAETLIELGVTGLARIPADRIRGVCTRAPGQRALLVVHHDALPSAALAPLVRRDGKPGFVVTDMVDVDDFTAVPVGAAAGRTAVSRARARSR